MRNAAVCFGLAAVLLAAGCDDEETPEGIDLKVASIRISNAMSLLNGDTLYVGIVLRSNGTETVAIGYTLDMKFYGDRALTTEIAPAWSITFPAGAALPAGEGNALYATTTVNVPVGDTPMLVFCVVQCTAAGDVDASNDSLVRTIQIVDPPLPPAPKADLVGGFAGAAEVYADGLQTFVKCTPIVTNIGAADATVDTRFKLRIKDQLKITVLVEEEFVCSPVPAGSFEDHPATVVETTSLSVDNYYLCMEVDTTMRVDESNEANNDDADLLFFNSVGAVMKPDLDAIINGFEFRTVVTDEYLDVEVTIRNVGQFGSSACDFTLAIFDAAHQVVLADVTPQCDALNVGGTFVYATTFDITALSSGSYSVEVFVDSGSTVDEESELNNVAWVDFDWP